MQGRNGKRSASAPSLLSGAFGRLGIALIVRFFGRRRLHFHLVDLSMKGASADSEFFGSGRDVAVGCRERLHDQTIF